MTRSSELLAAPDFHTSPPYKVTLGPEVCEVAELAGFHPYPEQRLMVDDAFALHPDDPNRMAAFDVAMICARQQMKTGWLKILALGWLFVTEEPLIIWSAHEFGTAAEAFRDMQGLIASSPDLDRRVAKIRTAAGSQQIEMKNGSRLRFKARSSGGGRGLTGSKVILDEAFALQPGMTGALLPTMIRKPTAQVVYASSAGMASSAVLRSIRDRGRAGSERVAYAEWLAPRKDCQEPTCQHAVGTPGCALDDLDLWRKSCPISARDDWDTMQAIANLRNSPSLTPEEFMRELLGWWDEPLGDAPIPETVWNSPALVDNSSTITTDPVFVLEVSPTRDWACITAGGQNGAGRTHVQITKSNDPYEWDHRPGTGWVPSRLKSLLKGRPVWIATGSAAESLVPDIELAGLTVKRIPARDVVSACGRFYDMVHAGSIVHPDQTEMTTAVCAARQKWVGEKSFTWVRPPGVSDITPMYGATLAAWLAAFSGYDLMASIG